MKCCNQNCHQGDECPYFCEKAYRQERAFIIGAMIIVALMILLSSDYAGAMALTDWVEAATFSDFSLGMLIAFFVTQIGDAVTTYMILKRGGSERNPVIRAVIERIGLIPALVCTKIPVMIAMTILASFHWIGPAAGVIVYIVVLENNLKQIKK